VASRVCPAGVGAGVDLNLDHRERGIGTEMQSCAPDGIRGGARYAKRDRNKDGEEDRQNATLHVIHTTLLASLLRRHRRYPLPSPGVERLKPRAALSVRARQERKSTGNVVARDRGDRVAGMAPPDELQPQAKKSSWRTWALGIAVLLVVILIAQNSQDVKVKFLFVDTTTPLIFALLIAAVLGAVIGYVGPLVRRHRGGD
jgi:uncharacterized integral membrane protein